MNDLLSCSYIGEHQGYQIFETYKLEGGLYELTTLIREQNSRSFLYLLENALKFQLNQKEQF